MENQALGLAEALARLTPAEVVVRRVRWRGTFDRLPSALKAPWMLDGSSDPVAPAPGAPWPDVWIGTGRAALPLSARVKRRSGGKTFVVQTQDPRWRTGVYDLVVAPDHDGLAGPNVLSIVGSPHRVNAEGLAAAAAAFAERLAPLPRPRVAVLVGGRSRAHDLPQTHAAQLADAVARAVGEAGGSVMVTFSRRTPEAARIAMTERLAGLPGEIWSGEGPNPYFAYLHFADQVLVTADSANMAAEAASTGKPVHVLPMVPLKPAPKFDRLHAALNAHGATRPFDGRLDVWTYDPLAETERAAREILGRLA
ncbi:MAG: mitochondrial fission ELM1 family protein [Alphaproteobacteria bacterium]|nr:mitochondrial fission ELM1 family protein [Alphaproteobacteria bacterium]MBU1526392.1 mitochondrial fission ELM1 family protein [Alphaproteobacteria bacterium]MBU2117392.1 mitochondrial fission ELM1 family protein [Alphaproteobacteria bacterium]MBU2349972.1 mitochondrial fission ELM1 family protein [Alphaproteobacteria bacterium]MBU2382677.1 mitochondrial fission ELM1 family protein [Alphaproteobacteria bacterium]